MRAVVLRETGGTDRLELADLPEPEAPSLEVRAAGVNFMDVLIRAGRYPQPPELPYVPGAEVAGDLDGRRVIALTRASGGGYAERAVVDPDWVVPLPDRATYEEGAAFLMTYLTAYLPLRRQARLEPGATVLVHAGAGGVGSAAIQLAQHFGARVVATAGSPAKRKFTLELGADAAYGYDDFGDHVRADVVLDPVGGDLVAASLKVLEPLGVHVAIGFAGGPWAAVDPALLVGRNIGLHGFYLGRLLRHRPQVVRDALRDLAALWEQGAVKPTVGAVYALEEAPEAHRLIEERRHVGKVVLVP